MIKRKNIILIKGENSREDEVEDSKENELQGENLLKLKNRRWSRKSKAEKKQEGIAYT